MPRDQVQDPGQRVGAALVHIRLNTFGPADEEPFRRRTSDWIRVVVGAGVFAVLVVNHDQIGALEASLFDTFNDLPDDLEPLFRALYAVGTLWAVGIILIAALVGQRWRLARDLTVAGVLASLSARLVSALTGGYSTTEAVKATVRFGSSATDFPLVRLSVMVAVIAAAAPYVTRPTRQLGVLFATVMALSAMYLGTGYPNAVIAGAVLGWSVAAAVHLVFGSPGGRPTLPQMRATLAELGVDVDRLRLATHQPGDATEMVAVDGEGPLRIRVLGRDERDAQVLGRAWRSIVFRSPPGRLQFSRIEAVEHEAYAVLRAQQAGVHVPTVVTTGTAGPGVAVYVERPVVGTPLSQIPPAEVTEALLEEVWRAVGRLHDAGIAHLDLTADHVVITDAGPALIAFASAMVSDPSDFRRRDIAALLVATEGIVGADRAVAAAAFGIGRERLIDALPLIQSAVLPSALRARSRVERKQLSGRLERLRIVASAVADVEPPQLTEVHRMSGSTLALIIGTFLGVAALLGQVGDPQELWDTMAEADWRWIWLAIAISLSTNLATAIALMGSVPIRIPFLRTVELQLSLTFANLAVPTIGGLAAQVRYLQKQGVDLAGAVAAGGVVSGVANVVVTSAVCLLAILLSPAKVSTSAVSADQLLTLLFLAAIVIGLVSAVVFGIPAIRAKVLAPVQDAWSVVSAAMRSPRQIGQLVLGWAANALLYALVLWCCVQAFGPAVNFWTIVLINTGVSTLAFAVPVPGGSTAVSSVGVAGLLTAVGVSPEVAVAASLAYQVTATFIPAVPGWVAFRNLMSLDYL